jgi:UDP-N-acetylmuramate dehydrogenase
MENIPLAPLTTLKVGGPARYFVDARTEQDVKDSVAYAADHHLPLFILGGGSNLVVADQGWPGLVLKISLRGVEFEGDRERMLFHAAAGETWDDLVALSVRKNCSGIECLSGIPGSVGGTPVQNVGAYGQEVSEIVTTVHTLKIATGETFAINNADCGFAYRTSNFNSAQRGQFIVLKVSYRLHRADPPRIEYADLKNFFAQAKTETPTLQQVRDAVCSIRQSKAMLIVSGDADCRSAGSFFKNPLVSAAEAERLQGLAQQRVPGKKLPCYQAEGGRIKLSAAWLVEQSGFHKGYTQGKAGISRKHALAIVNLGDALAQDIVTLKDEVQKKVFDLWDVSLQPEPEFVGFAAQ